MSSENKSMGVPLLKQMAIVRLVQIPLQAAIYTPVRIRTSRYFGNLATERESVVIIQ